MREREPRNGDTREMAMIVALVVVTLAGAVSTVLLVLSVLKI